MKEECNPKRKEEYCPMEGRNTNGVKIYYEYRCYLFLMKGIKEMKTNEYIDVSLCIKRLHKLEEVHYTLISYL